MDEIGDAGAGMLGCDLLLAQSIVFHAIDYARALGFEPHRDFPGVLFGPRPEQLVDTPWHESERPIYVMGPYDDVSAITNQLTKVVGADGFEFIDPLDDDGEDDDDDDGDAEGLVRSPLSCTVSRDGIAVRIHVYRATSETQWLLEVEDSAGGSTVWDAQFETDRAAFE